MPSCCSVGITNSKIYIDCSLCNRPQTYILQPPSKGGLEEASMAPHSRVQGRLAGERAGLLCGTDEGRTGTKGGNGGEGCLWLDEKGLLSGTAACEGGLPVSAARGETQVSQLRRSVAAVRIVLLP